MLFLLTFFRISPLTMIFFVDIINEKSLQFQTLMGQWKAYCYTMQGLGCWAQKLCNFMFDFTRPLKIRSNAAAILHFNFCTDHIKWNLRMRLSSSQVTFCFCLIDTMFQQVYYKKKNCGWEGFRIWVILNLTFKAIQSQISRYNWFPNITT